MVSHWPIIFQGDAADKSGWALCSGRSCFRWLHIGPLFFWEMLQMHRMGPLQWQQQFSAASHWSIIFFGDVADKLGLAHCRGRS